MEQHPKYNEVKAYLTGGLSKEDEIIFKKAIQQDKTLANELQLQTIEREAIERMITLDLKEKIGKWEDNPPPNPFEEEEKMKKSSAAKKWIILLLVAIGLFWGAWQMFFSPVLNEKSSTNTLKETSPPPQQKEEKKDIPIAVTEKPKVVPKKIVQKKNIYLVLAMDGYNKAAEDFTFKTQSRGEIKEKSNIEQAIEAYTKEKFLVARALIGKPAENEENEVIYLRGHINFNLKLYAAAVTQFEAIVNQKGLFVAQQEEAKWYLLLSYLAQYPNEEANFEALAVKLAKEEFFYKKEALLTLQKTMK